MAEAKDNTATPPAASGGIDLTAVNAAIAAALKPVAEAIATLTPQLTELQKNQKVLADTFANQKAPDLAALEKMVSEGVVKILDSRDAAAKQSAQTKARLDAFLADPANGLAKLPAEFKSRLGDDPSKWAEEAKGIVGSWEKFVKDAGIKIPDVGGATREGGTAASAGGGSAPAPVGDGLTDGERAFAAGMKLPTAASN